MRVRAFRVWVLAVSPAVVLAVPADAFTVAINVG